MDNDELQEHVNNILDRGLPLYTRIEKMIKSNVQENFLDPNDQNATLFMIVGFLQGTLLANAAKLDSTSQTAYYTQAMIDKFTDVRYQQLLNGPKP